ncbi:hypothetical protein OG819_42465 [Streptomyces sp. NBC_01549]|uniref:hypothetical protein n=1 Tax=Streptomyces sp. NBC_01549 TaxID=2975874 RepID=UPI00224E8DCD|nr:hypothetical protein [Streptomyces sp. NBC_01549]MCX4596080.1 hypothetical protein [Streptomyces sp. NBC_01549]
MPVDPWAIDTLVFSGLEARNNDSMFIMGNGSALGATSGVRPGDPGLTVTLAGTTINCSAGVAAVAYSGQGVYRAAFPSSVSPGTYTAAHATLNRIDLVYLRVWDNSVDASGLNKADIVYLAGTPSASPVAPTPAGTQIYMPLATISVLSVANGGTASVSTAVRPSTVAPGGILPSPTAPSSPYTGQFYDNGTDLLRWNGASWDTYYKVPGAWTSYTPTWTATTTNPVVNNGTLVGRYSKIGRQVTVHINLVPGSTTTYGSGNYNWALPFAAANNGCSYILQAHLLGSDRWMGQMVISPGASTTSAFFNLSTTNTRIDFMTPARPETFANGSQLRITGTYESV